MITLVLFSSLFQYLRTVIMSPLTLCHFITKNKAVPLNWLSQFLASPCVFQCCSCLPTLFNLFFSLCLNLVLPFCIPMESFFSISQSIPTQQSPCHALLSGSSQSSFNCHICGSCIIYLGYFTGTMELPT